MKITYGDIKCIYLNLVLSYQIRAFSSEQQ